MNCPSCNTEVVNENLNIRTNVGQCQHCNHIFKISEMLTESYAKDFDVMKPPQDAWPKRVKQHHNWGHNPISHCIFHGSLYVDLVGWIAGWNLLASNIRGQVRPYSFLVWNSFFIGIHLFLGLDHHDYLGEGRNRSQQRRRQNLYWCWRHWIE
jgi:hypothetical protein